MFHKRKQGSLWLHILYWKINNSTSNVLATLWKASIEIVEKWGDIQWWTEGFFCFSDERDKKSPHFLHWEPLRLLVRTLLCFILSQNVLHIQHHQKKYSFYFPHENSYIPYKSFHSQTIQCCFLASNHQLLTSSSSLSCGGLFCNASKGRNRWNDPLPLLSRLRTTDYSVPSRYFTFRWKWDIFSWREA